MGICYVIENISNNNNGKLPFKYKCILWRGVRSDKLFSKYNFILKYHDFKEIPFESHIIFVFVFEYLRMGFPTKGDSHYNYYW